MKDSEFIFYKLFQVGQRPSRSQAFISQFEERLGAPLTKMQKRVAERISSQILEDFQLGNTNNQSIAISSFQLGEELDRIQQELDAKKKLARAHLTLVPDTLSKENKV